MHILFINRKSGFFGGVEQNVVDTAAGLRQHGHRCTLAFGEETGGRSEAYSAHFDAHYACRELGAESALSLTDIIAREMPDIVYLHKVPNLRQLLPALATIPAVMMVHDHDLCCPRRHKYYACSGRVCHRAMGIACYADAAFLERGTQGIHLISLRDKAAEMRAHYALTQVLVGSTFMRDELLSNGFNAAQVRILPPQVARLVAADPTPIPDTPELLYVGQLVRGKGVDLLLNIVARHVPEGQLRIVGKGNAEAGLRDQAQRLGLLDRVQFLGWVDHDQLDDRYRAARVVVVPSRWPEPFGMVGLEAMSHARPVVAFAVGGIPDWLRDGINGYTVPEQDTAAFGQALRCLLHNDALANRLGAEGYRIYCNEYKFSEYIHSLEELFLRVMRTG